MTEHVASTSNPASCLSKTRLSTCISPWRQWRPCLPNRGSRCVRHYFQLHQAAGLLFFQVFSALLDVDVIPRQNLGHRAGALGVRGRVDTEIGKGLPLAVGLEAFAPAVEVAA